MMKKLMLTAAFAGVVMFLAAGCSSFCKMDDSCKKCDDKGASVEKPACPMKTNCDVKVEAPAK